MLKGTVYIQIFAEQNVFPNPQLRPRTIDSFTIVRNYLVLQNYVTSEGDVSHKVVYYQQLSVARYQVSFYAKYKS